MRRLRMILVVGLAGAWPALAGAEILPSQGGSGSQMTTSPSGFVGLTGPNGYSPVQSQTYLPPPATPACPSCAPSGKSQPPPGQPAQH